MIQIAQPGTAISGNRPHAAGVPLIFSISRRLVARRPARRYRVTTRVRGYLMLQHALEPAGTASAAGYRRLQHHRRLSY
ncbi:MAG TPA: hypothetical protein VE733_30165 [Streptosporangiaceae bacterium]|nr:hypothetical protein [Streptosporangiaceae bacterium]